MDVMLSGLLHEMLQRAKTGDSKSTWKVCAFFTVDFNHCLSNTILSGILKFYITPARSDSCTLKKENFTSFLALDLSLSLSVYRLLEMSYLTA